MSAPENHLSHKTLSKHLLPNVTYVNLLDPYAIRKLAFPTPGVRPSLLVLEHPIKLNDKSVSEESDFTLMEMDLKRDESVVPSLNFTSSKSKWEVRRVSGKTCDMILEMFMRVVSKEPRHCAYPLVRFRHNNHSVRVRKSCRLCAKYLFWSAQTWLEMAWLPVEKKIWFWFIKDGWKYTKVLLQIPSSFSLTNAKT